ncbi:MAG: DUF721 domain-containing protein [Treponema sp.]|nr:DUF721 domain-containing protein [Treponema sp.]
MDEAVAIGNLITQTFKNISRDKYEQATSTVNIWKKVLRRIKSNRNPNEGQNLSDHTSVVDLKNGVLLVEADHPGWIELLQLHKKYILNGLRMENSSLGIENIVFRLKGKKADIYDFQKENEAEVKKLINEKVIKEEENLKNLNLGKKNEKKPKKEVSPEFAELLENFKNDVLKG